MKVKIQHDFTGDITEEEITPLYICQHVNDENYYATLKDVEFDKTTEYILVEDPNSCYGFSVLWLVDRKNKIYEYDGCGHSGACSIICSLLQKLNEVNNDPQNKNTKLEQECEKLKQTVRAYQEDRFCQGGCAIYQYDKIHKLTHALDEIEKTANKDFTHTAREEYKKQLIQILAIVNKAKEQ